MKRSTIFIILGFLTISLVAIVSALVLRKGTQPPESSIPTVPPELLQEKGVQEEYAKERAKFLQEKIWLLKLPLKSNSYFISYDPEQEEFLATIYFALSSSASKESQLSQAKQDAIEAIRSLGLDPASVKIVFFETEKKFSR